MMFPPMFNPLSKDMTELPVLAISLADAGGVVMPAIIRTPSTFLELKAIVRKSFGLKHDLSILVHIPSDFSPIKEPTRIDADVYDILKEHLVHIVVKYETCIVPCLENDETESLQTPPPKSLEYRPPPTTPLRQSQRSSTYPSSSIPHPSMDDDTPRTLAPRHNSSTYPGPSTSTPYHPIPSSSYLSSPSLHDEDEELNPTRDSEVPATPSSSTAYESQSEEEDVETYREGSKRNMQCESPAATPRANKVLSRAPSSTIRKKIKFASTPQYQPYSRPASPASDTSSVETLSLVDPDEDPGFPVTVVHHGASGLQEVPCIMQSRKRVRALIKRACENLQLDRTRARILLKVPFNDHEGKLQVKPFDLDRNKTAAQAGISEGSVLEIVIDDIEQSIVLDDPPQALS